MLAELLSLVSADEVITFSIDGLRPGLPPCAEVVKFSVTPS
jgi:hypothetical protein